MKKTLIIIGGPTAIGKTKLAIKLAQEWKSEIISADARQFYKELNIGVAKPSKKDLNIIPHHFIGHISIQDSYSVGHYEKDTLKLLDKLFKKHNILFVCGGSGLYIQSICEGLNYFPKVTAKIKQAINHKLITKGLYSLKEELKSIDIETYKKIDKKNPRRITRALEICRSSEKPYSFYTNKKIPKRDFQTLYITLNTPRKLLYDNINNRVDEMIKNGLMKEAEILYEHKNKQALQTIGYQEIFKYIDQEISLEEAVEQIKKNTRRYAKRQITWFKQKKYHPLESIEEESIYDFIKKSI